MGLVNALVAASEVLNGECCYRLAGIYIHGAGEKGYGLGTLRTVVGMTGGRVASEYINVFIFWSMVSNEPAMLGVGKKKGGARGQKAGKEKSRREGSGRRWIRQSAWEP